VDSLEQGKSRRDDALDMLDDLDIRHDSLLIEIDALSARIDGVLGEYSKQRGGSTVVPVLSAEPALLEPDSENDLRGEAPR
jgi:hypothetical protein